MFFLQKKTDFFPQIKFYFGNIPEKNKNEKMSDQKNLEPDLDFLRYADDVRESKSLKKFIDSGKEKRFRIRTKEIRLEIKNQFFCQNEPFLSKKNHQIRLDIEKMARNWSVIGRFETGILPV